MAALSLGGLLVRRYALSNGIFATRKRSHGQQYQHKGLFTSQALAFDCLWIAQLSVVAIIPPLLVQRLETCIYALGIYRTLSEVGCRPQNRSTQ